MADFHDDDKFGVKGAACVKCHLGPIYIEWSGFCDASSVVQEDCESGEIEEESVSHDWHMSGLYCANENCGWKFGFDGDDPDEDCREFLEKLKRDRNVG